jgi:hypothetical protein
MLLQQAACSRAAPSQLGCVVWQAVPCRSNLRRAVPGPAHWARAERGIFLVRKIGV